MLELKDLGDLLNTVDEKLMHLIRSRGMAITEGLRKTYDQEIDKTTELRDKVNDHISEFIKGDTALHIVISRDQSEHGRDFAVDKMVVLSNLPRSAAAMIVDDITKGDTTNP